MKISDKNCPEWFIELAFQAFDTAANSALKHYIQRDGFDINDECYRKEMTKKATELWERAKIC